MIKPCIVIPVYDHENAIGTTLRSLLRFCIPILLIDDGSHAPCRDYLKELSKKYADDVTLFRLPTNQGKGAAVKEGIEQAQALGYTHAIQIDADGQHNEEDIPLFFEAAAHNPRAVITGVPRFTENVPKVRLYSRYLTHIWVWINTLSFAIKDAMCGFRVYPVEQVSALLSEEKLGNRMEFDIEILVHWVWRKGPVRNIETTVNYPSDGVSHFDTVKDNILISATHARLFFGMCRRLPALVRGKIARG